MTKRTPGEQNPAPEPAGLALLSNILEILSSQENPPDSLLMALSALQRLIPEWQSLLSQLNSQLEFVLQANALQREELTELRSQVQAAQERAYAAEARALQAEDRLTKLRRSNA